MGGGGGPAPAQEPAVDDLLTRLEEAIGRLADPRAPLGEVVRSYEEASRLLGAAEARLAAVSPRLARLGGGESGPGAGRGPASVER